jgi:hypothetical protein
MNDIIYILSYLSLKFVLQINTPGRIDNIAKDTKSRFYYYIDRNGRLDGSLLNNILCCNWC